MTDADIAEAVASLRRESLLPVEPAVRGPVQMHRIFQEQELLQTELPDLTRGRVMAILGTIGFQIDDAADPDEPLDGFIFTSDSVGFIFICRNARNILPRRRFSVAHEIGHHMLHRERMRTGHADAEIDGTATDPMEREADRFAAELLMPRAVCEARAEEMQRTAKACPRAVLAYRLAAELLVSHQAMGLRLDELEVGDE